MYIHMCVYMYKYMMVCNLEEEMAKRTQAAAGCFLGCLWFRQVRLKAWQFVCVCLSLDRPLKEFNGS